MIRNSRSVVAQQIATVKKVCSCASSHSKSRNEESSPEPSGLSLVRPVWFTTAARLAGSNRVKIKKKKTELERDSNHPDPDPNPYPNVLGTKPTTFVAQMWVRYPYRLAAPISRIVLCSYLSIPCCLCFVGTGYSL